MKPWFDSTHPVLQLFRSSAQNKGWPQGPGPFKPNHHGANSQLFLRYCRWMELIRAWVGTNYNGSTHHSTLVLRWSGVKESDFWYPDVCTSPPSPCGNWFMIRLWKNRTGARRSLECVAVCEHDVRTARRIAWSVCCSDILARAIQNPHVYCLQNIGHTEGLARPGMSSLHQLCWRFISIYGALRYINEFRFDTDLWELVYTLSKICRHIIAVLLHESSSVLCRTLTLKLSRQLPDEFSSEATFKPMREMLLQSSWYIIRPCLSPIASFHMWLGIEVVDIYTHIHTYIHTYIHYMCCDGSCTLISYPWSSSLSICVISTFSKSNHTNRRVLYYIVLVFLITGHYLKWIQAHLY